ncbi:flagellar brake protein [Dechloromonas sp. XY25]|uniref:Flagellar brake protein YcgR n=1 Tax=Dechloromonas hankyongensis TaxID=2908002 RepID=A0ABS9K0H9_9RHOO|nr:flagellar brake protein [Dechloromonas hankyongensis]MCG2576663.1 flagellar brake protein [Dechloromonas hankyongensis]
MSQIAQLSEAEIEDRFQISGARPVGFMLSGFARDGDRFSVHFGNELFLTTLLSAHHDKGLVFDCSGSNELNQRFLASERNVFVGRPHGIHVQFATGRAREILFSGSKAFAVALPKTLVRLQRRDTFRIETPRGRPLSFLGRLAGGALLTQPGHDISVAGVGLSAGMLPDGLVPGTVLENCRFALPEDEHDLRFSATLRHVTELEGRSGQRQWRLGLQFNDLPPADQNRIQRYIARVERERNELL